MNSGYGQNFLLSSELIERERRILKVTPFFSAEPNSYSMLGLQSEIYKRIYKSLQLNDRAKNVM